MPLKIDYPVVCKMHISRDETDIADRTKGKVLFSRRHIAAAAQASGQAPSRDWLEQPKVRDVHLLRLDGELITWHKAPVLGQGGYAACYVGMRSSQAPVTGLQAPQTSSPCLVRSRIYLPGVQLVDMEAQDNLPTANVEFTAEDVVAREDYIGRAVSPNLFKESVSVRVARKDARGGARVLSVGPLLHGDVHRLAAAADRHDIAPESLLRLFLQDVAPKMARMHTRFIHNDIKANNFLFHCQHGELTFEIADFGYANVLPSALAQDLPYRIPQGTWGDVSQRNALNASEESLAGHVDDPGSDVFSLGLMLLQVLAGDHPFSFMKDHAAVLTPRLRMRVFDAFEACRPRNGSIPDGDGSPLQRRFSAMWGVARSKASPPLFELLSAMVKRTHALGVDARGGFCARSIAGALRPTMGDIAAWTRANPLDAAAEAAVRAVASALSEGAPCGSAAAVSLDLARVHHACLRQAFEF